MIHDREKITLDVTADDSVTSADTSVSLGLIVTELVINALKHAFPGEKSGKIHVDYSSHGPDWQLYVEDDGIGMPEHSNPAKAGLGTSIVQALASQLSACVNLVKVVSGTKVVVAHDHVPILAGQATPAPNAV
jgi:two-component sensor histidine kinase